MAPLAAGFAACWWLSSTRSRDGLRAQTESQPPRRATPRLLHPALSTPPLSCRPLHRPPRLTPHRPPHRRQGPPVKLREAWHGTNRHWGGRFETSKGFLPSLSTETTCRPARRPRLPHACGDVAWLP
jgi:hypothetical protein